MGCGEVFMEKFTNIKSTSPPMLGGMRWGGMGGEGEGV